jgi:hypothetical protein
MLAIPQNSKALAVLKLPIQDKMLLKKRFLCRKINLEWKILLGVTSLDNITQDKRKIYYLDDIKYQKTTSKRTKSYYSENASAISTKKFLKPF